MKNILKVSLTISTLVMILFASPGVAATPAPTASKSSMSGMSGMSTMNHPTPTPSVAQAVPAPGGGTFLTQTIPAKVLNTPLFDTNGKTITLGSLKGQTVVIADFLTSCQEICPMTSANMRQIGDAVAASKAKGKVTVLEVSVDSWRDTASRLKAYQSLFNDTNWVIAGGTKTNLDTFWGYFGASIQKAAYTAADMKKLPVDWQTGKVNTFDISHTDEVVIVGPNSTWSWLDLGNPNPGKDSVPAKLKAYLDEDGLNNLAKPQEPSWSPAAVYSALKSITGIKIGA
jgi:cytochrome oxidase Cu insertion factor (SCO1/SenC/PrrC family)